MPASLRGASKSDIVSQGDTLEAALANLREALELYFEGEPLPRTPLGSVIVVPIDVTV